jgi:hypothetical protein
MSDLCKQECFAYALCVERGSEDPTAYNRSFRQMMGTEGLHTEEQIKSAQALQEQGDLCASEAPATSKDCRIVAAAVLKNTIG